MVPLSVRGWLTLRDGLKLADLIRALFGVMAGELGEEVPPWPLRLFDAGKGAREFPSAAS